MGSPPWAILPFSVLTGILNRAHWRCAAVRRGAREEAKRRTLNSFSFTQYGDANTRSVCRHRQLCLRTTHRSGQTFASPHNGPRVGGGKLEHNITISNSIRKPNACQKVLKSAPTSGHIWSADFPRRAPGKNGHSSVLLNSTFWLTGHRRQTVLGAARRSRALAVGPTVESPRQGRPAQEGDGLHTVGTNKPVWVVVPGSYPG